MWEIDREAYAAEVARHAAEPASPGAVILVGDSLTAWSGFDQRRAGVVLRGIPGDQADLLYARLPEIVARAPAQLFLMIGINDLLRARPPADVAADCRAIVDFVRARAPATRIVVQSVLPSGSAELNADVDALNLRLCALAAATGSRWLDVHAAFLRDGQLLPGLIDPDGVHLTAAGYDAWWAALSPLL